MRYLRYSALATLALGALLAGWTVYAQQTPRETELGHGLPGLKQSQIEDLLKHDHKKSIEDASELIKQAEDLKAELEKNTQHVISMKAFKQTEEIEKIAKRIRGRMRRF